MRRGDLVRVRWGGELNQATALGEVRDYRPDVLGGSSSQCWRDERGNVHNETVQYPRRGQVLVLTYEDGGICWWDESNVEHVEEEEHGL